jgi:2-dehydropantoate 2-reductase
MVKVLIVGAAGLWPQERIVQVTSVLLAFPSPSGMTYPSPPGAATGVSGLRAPQVVAALRAGGVRARRVRRAGAGEMTAARMIPFIAALEQAGWSLPRLLPFDLWHYLESHFTKVGAQTRLVLDGWIAEGAGRGLPVKRLKVLRAGLNP